MINAVFLAGQTGVGKSAVAIQLAEATSGEIISVDSMQVYRGMDIGTAKPSEAERARVPHHLVDILNLSESFDAAQFVRHAKTAENDVRSRGRTPIYCGGTGLYFRALIDGLRDMPACNPALRAELESAPLEALLQELEAKDPAHFAKVDRQNPRRVIRAIETIRLTGKPISEQPIHWENREDRNKPRVFCLERSAGDLRKRIEMRVEEMFRRGLVEETRALIVAGLETNRNAMQALGYRQVVEHLHGARPLEETVALVKIRTWQFARRQATWFRKQPNVIHLKIQTTESDTQIAERVMEAMKKTSHP